MYPIFSNNKRDFFIIRFVDSYGKYQFSKFEMNPTVEFDQDEPLIVIEPVYFVPKQAVDNAVMRLIGGNEDTAQCYIHDYSHEL